VKLKSWPPVRRKGILFLSGTRLEETMMKRLLCFVICVSVLAGPFLLPTVQAAADEKKSGEEKIKPLLPAAWVDTFKWRSIGPAAMGGRITDVAVSAKDPNIWWAATASGGLLKTTNNGTTFEHQFDHENTVSIGDVAVAPSNHDIVWVGTGEANPRNSVSWGDGVYKSVDGGRTWTHMGLKESFQIGRIAIHPEKPDIVYVGALGRLWGPNQERGLYKTTDGGKTWEKIFYVNDKTGIIDVQICPGSPDTLLLAAYERERDGFDSNDPKKKWGPGSGIYKTKDGGASFRKITEGLPSCQLGRIGLDYCQSDPELVFAVIESEKIAQEPENAPYIGIRGEDVEVGARLTEITEGGPAEEAGLKKGDIILSIEDETVHSYSELLKVVRHHLAGDTVKMEISRNRESVIVELTFSKRPGSEEDAESESESRRRRRSNAFSSGLGGQRENMQDQQGKDGHEFGGIYKSTDGGETWTRINSVNPRPMYYSQVRVDPSNPEHVYVLGTSLYRSKDGGETFSSDGGGRSVHVDHHAMWIDPRDGRHIILGNDGGIYVTYDRMKNWDHLNHVAIGQFYHVGVGPRRDYMVYGGLQDNGSWGGPSLTRTRSGPVNEDWIRIGGGDGFICLVDADDPDQVYYASQNGGLGRINLKTGDQGYMRARAPRGTRYRFNWKTPYLLSHHNSGIYYMAGNYVFRSLSQGDNLKPISPEISATDKGAATALAESPRDPDLLYSGTNDGLLWKTENGGREWINLFDIPEKMEKKEKKDAAAPPVASTGDRPERRGEGRGDRSSRGGGRGGRFIEMLKSQDANGDGRIEKGEVSERMAGFFDRLDTNSDGVIDEDEMKAMAERRGGGARPEESAERESGQPEEKPESKPDPESKAPETEQPKEQPESEQPDAEPPQEGKQPEAGKPQESSSAEPVAADDPVSGEWAAQAMGEQIPAGEGKFSMTLKLGDGGKVTGTFTSRLGEGEIVDGRYKADSASIAFAFDTEQMTLEFSAKISKGRMSGSMEMGGGIYSFEFEAKRSGDAAKTDAAAADGATADSGKPAKPGKSIDKLLPDPRWVSSIEPSRFKKERVYVTFDGHRSNDDEPYPFVSDDMGETWQPIRSNLPAGCGSTRVIREDRENQDILYLGTEFALFVYIDRGATWTRLNSNLPTVAVHEVAQHPSLDEIVVATHGRSIWVLDVTPLRQMNAETVQDRAFLYKPSEVVFKQSEPSRGGTIRRFVGENPPSDALIFYSIGKKAGRIRLEIKDMMGDTIKELEANPEPGFHVARWDLRRPSPEGQRSRWRRGSRIDPGDYLVVLTTDNQTLTQKLRVSRDSD